jgi:hypothetical protein
MSSKYLACVALMGLSLSLLSLLSIALGHSYQPSQLAVVASMLLMGIMAIGLVRNSRDVLHPLAVLVAVWLLRTGLPAVLLMVGAEPQMPHFIMEWAEPRWWIPGFHLGGVGCFSVAFGFILTSPRRRDAGRMSEWLWGTESLRGSAILVMLLGIALMAYYMLTNFGSAGGVFSALDSGILRAADEYTRPGTSRYSYFGKQCLLWGSVLWGLSLYRQYRSIYRALIPAAIAFALVVPFGGRIVAVAPLAISLLTLWYESGRLYGFQAVGAARLARWAVCMLVALIIFIYAGMLVRSYRSGGGVQMVRQQLAERTLADELLFSVWNETGFLHPLGYAIMFDTGAFQPTLGRLFFGGYSAHLLGLDAEVHPGEGIVIRLTGVGGWGIHTGAVVDLFFWHGLPAVVLGCALLGVILKVAYVRLARDSIRPVDVAVYAYLFWIIFWAMFETIIGVPSMVLEGALALVATLWISYLIQIAQASARKGRHGNRMLPRRGLIR